jgi:hypothetical protein
VQNVVLDGKEDLFWPKNFDDDHFFEGIKFIVPLFGELFFERVRAQGILFPAAQFSFDASAKSFEIFEMQVDKVGQVPV